MIYGNKFVINNINHITNKLKVWIDCLLVEKYIYYLYYLSLQYNILFFVL